ncbi:tail fiber domain-containing protein, partial [Candidatus Zixiibacteriota bacterium]
AGSDGDWTISGDDMYAGVAGRVGIGTTVPGRKLDVKGSVSGSDTTVGSYGILGDATFGVSGYCFAGNAVIGSSYNGDGVAGVSYNGAGVHGSSTTGNAGHFDGNVRMTGFEMPTGASAGHVLTSDGSGLGTWQALAAVSDGDWTISGDHMYSAVPGSVGIGTVTPAADLHIASQGNPELRLDNDDWKSTLSFYQSSYIRGYLMKDDDDGRLNLSANGSTDHMVILESSGNVGVGKIYPVSELDVNGDINADGVYKLDGTTVLSTEGNANVIVGKNAGKNNTGNWLTCVGDSAGFNNQTSFNVFVGQKSGFANTSGWGASFMGWRSGRSNTTGFSNTFIGASAGEYNTEGWNNTFVGWSAGQENATGKNNTCLGYNAGGNANLGNANTYLGWAAGYNSTGTSNIFIGFQAGQDDTSSNRLIIESSGSTSPLIWGDFANDRLVINGNESHNSNNRTFFSNGSAGGTTGWYNDSDAHLKKEIATIPDALRKVQQLRGVNFEWRDTDRHDPGRQMGFVAQEAVKVIPEVVTGEDGHYAMQYGPITALLVEAVKELRAENRELKKEIEAIKAEIR